MPSLFSAFELRGVTFKNRVSVSPMSQYRAQDGFANDWHLVHLGRFVMGGAALVYAEATAVTRDGRRTPGDLGLWDDSQIAPLARIADFITREGSVPGIQLSHAGRKASERRPWHGETPLDDEDAAVRSEHAWPAMAPSALPYAEGWPTPREMSDDDIQAVISAFGAAAKRAKTAGFKVIEVYAAHGFLVHQFLSPITNQRQDKWGGNTENRARFAVEVAREIRRNWPEDLPLAFRLSASDWMDNGLTPEDTVDIAIALKSAGVDLIDCSSGGIGGKDRPQRMTIEHGFQVPFAAQVRSEANIPTMAVGFIWDAAACDTLIDRGDADMIALARELLDDPNWPLHAASQLGRNADHTLWPVESGWWLMKRDRLLSKLGLR
ncbi:NADH:flavin oxidoreductase/NADH oxidase [Ruegeria lacuscaerulensis]|uniref:NADH:flavin oxidoreductase/NADH oxidase n=1 Tax=Ruegeria lacuscaerulensis TaxID=55218 RepID=UPI00147D6F54|nr:NADH:flavin oxidoreductase/NADH oxidase [Ruegeria lacuscaerulensis]